MYKNISIRKRFEVKTANSPTHDLVVINDNYDKDSSVVVGALWTKVAQDKNGTDYKFLSGKLNQAKTGTDGKVYEGYVLITEKEYEELKTGKPSNVDTGEAANIDDIGF